MKLELTKKEIQVLMDCVSIAEESINNNVVMATNEEMKRLEKIGANHLWHKLYMYRVEKVKR